jgi:uncharacterized protein (TIGR02145 family)
MTKTLAKSATAAAFAAIAAIGFSLNACEEKEKASKPTEAAVQQETQKPAVETGAFTDARDKKTYRTVKIGKQVWMAENLNYAAKGSMCLSNVQELCEAYGRLYDWAMAKTVCPAGWHLPSDAEWQTLVDFVGNEAGTKLRAANKCPEEEICGDGGDCEKSIPGTDVFGFAALESGFSTSLDDWYEHGGGFWWTATEVEANNPYNKGMKNAYNRGMSCTGYDVGRNFMEKTNLLSVRCIKD